MYNIVYINMLNSNDRIYDLEACEKIIEDFKNKPICYGCIEKMDDDFKSSVCIEKMDDLNVNEISHVVENMWIENNILKADIRILDSRFGRILKNMGNVRFATQSYGSINLDKTANISKFVTLNAVVFKDWAYSKYELREEKLKRILNL